MKINQEWDKSGVISHRLIIHDVQIIVYTHKVGLHFPPFPKKEKINRELVIWYDEIISDKLSSRIISVILHGEKRLPPSIQEAYQCIGLKEEQMQKHINKYVAHNEDIFVHYAFPSDDFFLIYNKSISELFLWGNPASLERILVNIFSMTGDALPFHAACVNINGKGVMILGDTNSGKTSLVLELLKHQAKYISDDILYVDNKLIGHRCCDFLSIRTRHVNSSLSPFAEFTKGDKSYFFIKNVCNQMNCDLDTKSLIDEIFLLTPLTLKNISCSQLFCAFRHDGMVMCEILGGNFPEKLNTSLTIWEKLTKLKNVNEVLIDKDNFNKTISDALDKYFI